VRKPTAAQLVSAWERGVALPPTARALQLLSAGELEVSADLARLPIGERDRRLLRLRRMLFGSRLDATVVCPACAGRVEFELELESLLLPSADLPAHVAIESGGVRWDLRPPTSIDLMTVTDGCHDRSDAEGALLQRCLTSLEDADRSGLEQAVWPAGLREAAAAKMAELDPQADIQIAVSCPSCQHAWLSDFDVVSFFWTELTSLVRRLLLDVHRLASAYGWSESEILSMSTERRAVYLELAGA